MGTYPRQMNNVSYSSASQLNTLDLYLPAPPPPNPASDTIWLIYIHGGAWRDPQITSPSFSQTQSHILSHPSPAIKQISGIASLNYRLSPYPSHPSDPSHPQDPARNVQHPDHITDILHAILYLQETYHFGENYVLIGHSCGATLAFQVAMRRFWGRNYESTLALELNVEPPLAIIGAEGIYDIPTLVEEYSAVPVYRELIANAFGSDEKTWQSASPARWDDYDGSWPEGTGVVLLHSDADELVSPRQSEVMEKALVEQKWKNEEGGRRRVALQRMQGLGHDEVWEDGRELAETIVWTLMALLEGER